jgi:hypothetical protein
MLLGPTGSCVEKQASNLTVLDPGPDNLNFIRALARLLRKNNCCDAYRNILQSGLGPFYLDEEKVGAVTHYWIKFRSVPESHKQAFSEFVAAHPEMPKLYTGSSLPFRHCPWCGARKYWGP